MTFHKFGALFAISLIASPLAVQAQAMTAEQILALLQAQRNQLADENGGLGASRTLEFIQPDNAPAGAGVSVVTEQPGSITPASTNSTALPESAVIDLTIFFEFDSALLKAESKTQVDALCSAIDASETAMAATNAENGVSGTSGHGSYQIIGHTDASGSVAYNLSLSQARADEVVRYMVRECGIDGSILEAVGMGEAKLKDPENPRSEVNRRVEIQVVL